MAEAVRQLQAQHGRSLIGKVVEVEPWSRIPERRAALMELVVEEQVVLRQPGLPVALSETPGKLRLSAGCCVRGRICAKLHPHMLSKSQLGAIRELVNRYEALSPAERQRYQETEVRTNFIDPLFAALGWPVYDREHVERETTVTEGKRPDYIFKIAGVPRFFLEAKPFREDIYDREETRKAITKAYNKGVPWVGITNFERLVLYDAQEELTEAEALPRRVFDLHYRDYPDTQAEPGIHLLTPDAIQSRALEKYAQRIGARRRVVPIEKRLYESMRGWREKLFNAFYQIKQWKTEAEFREGDEAIQRLIDRLIFLRNCEDRGIGATGYAPPTCWSARWAKCSAGSK